MKQGSKRDIVSRLLNRGKLKYSPHKGTFVLIPDKLCQEAATVILDMRKKNAEIAGTKPNPKTNRS